jgi:hypothetical protein
VLRAPNSAWEAYWFRAQLAPSVADAVLSAAGEVAMSKYNPLSARLAGHAGPEWRASFAEIEEVLGFPLPKGARSGKVWWRNTGAQPHQRAWTAGGWEVGDVDHATGLVTFRRKGTAPLEVRSPKPSPAVADEPAILSRLEATPKWTFALVATGLTIAAGLSVFAVRGWMRRR